MPEGLCAVSRIVVWFGLRVSVFRVAGEVPSGFNSAESRAPPRRGFSVPCERFALADELVALPLGVLGDRAPGLGGGEGPGVGLAVDADGVGGVACQACAR